MALKKKKKKVLDNKKDLLSIQNYSNCVISEPKLKIVTYIKHNYVQCENLLYWLQ